MTRIARLKIILNRVRPPVWRRIEVPLEITLEDLHLVIQATMGWGNCHLYAFSTPEGTWSSTDPHFGASDSLPAETTTLAQLRRRGGVRKFEYVYDFGDNWEHAVQVEAVVPREAGAHYPRLLKAKGACPPEDIGGPWGYAEYLAAISDPQHEQHREMLELYGRGLAHVSVDADAIRKRFERLAGGG
jgi:pRiA4b ORF-3-like protein